MKKILSFLLITLIVISLCACDTNNTDTEKQPVEEKVQIDTSEKSVLETVRDEIISSLEIEDAMFMETEKLNSLYGIDADKVKDSACFVTMSGTFPHEIIMVEADTKDDVDQISMALEKKLGEVLVQSKSYDAENYRLAQQCKVYTKDNYAVLFLSPEYAKMQTILEKYI